MVLFKDGFETNNFSRWTATVASGLSVVSVVATAPHHGVKNMNAYIINGAAAGNWCRAYYGSLAGSSHDHLFVRAMNVRIDQYLPTTLYHMRFLNFTNTTSGTQVAAATFGRSGANFYWALYTRHSAALSTTFSATAYTTNTNYMVEMEVQQSSVGNADGFVKLYVNSVLILTVPNLDNDDVAINYLHSGMQTSHITAQAYNIQLDCIQLDTKYIGKEVFTNNLIPKMTELITS